MKVYRYVIREYPNTQTYLLARLGLIRTREARVKNSFPVNMDSVRILINDYKDFIGQYPDNINSLEAARDEALLFANFLDKKDSAIQIINKLISNPRASLHLKSKAKLDLGDIYLLKGEAWESTLLYSQVEKVQKENPIGYDAKLRNAKLSYYKGDFRLAQEHLDILKQATTREISNDALDLSMRIKENIAFDSVGEALKQFASIELLLYQNKNAEALKAIEYLKEGRLQIKTKNSSGALSDSLASISNQTILDDVYLLEANIRMKQGEFEKAIGLLQKIIQDYGDDILADDAFFLSGEIYERQLGQKDKAMEIYREFLNNIPVVYMLPKRGRDTAFCAATSTDKSNHNCSRLHIPPVRKFDYECPVLNVEIIRHVIVGIHNEQIGCWLVPPLNSGVQIHVVLLLIVLCKGSKE